MFKNGKLMRLLRKVYFNVFFMLCLMGTAHARGGGGEPDFISGTKELFETVTNWLWILIPFGAGMILAFHAIQKILTDDQAVIAEKNRQMKNVLIAAVIGMVANSIIRVLLGFYGRTVTW